MPEFDVTPDQALEIIAEHGGYGKVRVYGIPVDGHVYAGQIVCVKSQYQLERYPLARLYAVTNNGYPPIFKA